MRRFAIRSAAAVAVAAATWSGAAVTAGSAAPLISHHPRVSAGGAHASSAGWASSNWSGYAITGSGFTSVTGAWKVPSVSATKRATFSSSWVGIDGFNDSNLIQTGTEQDYYSGSAHYNAWWEILPAAETVITTITVHPGDAMSATISQVSAGVFSITLRDANGNQSFSTTQSYGGQLTSAEWIQEAPTVGGRIATLAHYSSPTTFDPGTVDNGNPGLAASNSGVMIQGNAQVSTPSNPDSDTDGFNISYGSSAPSPPSS